MLSLASNALEIALPCSSVRLFYEGSNPAVMSNETGHMLPSRVTICRLLFSIMHIYSLDLVKFLN